MKIFFFTGWFPYPPNNGSRIRLYNFIKYLTRKHDVFLVSLLQEDSDPSDAEKLADICQVISLQRLKAYKPDSIRSYRGFLSDRPRWNVMTYNPAIQDAVREAVNQVQPDVIVASTLDVVEYLFDYLPQIPSILIDHNCEFGVLKRSTSFVSGKLKQWRHELGWRKAARWEAKVCRKFDAVIMPTEEDRQLMVDYAPDLTNISVIANAADTSLYDPACWAPERNRLVYQGAVTYSANLDAIEYFASEIYPLVARQIDGVHLVVTGRTGNVDVSHLTEERGVKLAGYVDDIRSELYRSAACVIPLRKGGGMRLKIPEAMAAGVPVVSTSMGAEGLDCVDNVHLLIADTPQDFANAIIRVLTDPALCETLRRNGRELTEKRYSWDISGKAFVDLVEEVAAIQKK